MGPPDAGDRVLTQAHALAKRGPRTGSRRRRKSAAVARPPPSFGTKAHRRLNQTWFPFCRSIFTSRITFCDWWRLNRANAINTPANPVGM
jgi:hypothetical protein